MNRQPTPIDKTIIFDLGRVLVQYDHPATLSGLAAVSDMEADELQRLTGGDIGARMGRGDMSAREFHIFLMKHAGVTADFEQFVQSYAAGIQRNEEALSYALTLAERPNLGMGVISNTNEVHALWLYANLPELKCFDHVILSNEVGMLKPDVRIYKMSLAALGALPARTLFVDDIAENVASAKTMGMAGIVHGDWATSGPQIEMWLAKT